MMWGFIFDFSPGDKTLNNVVRCFVYTGWPKKVSNYQESSLNRIKNVTQAIDFSLSLKWTREYYIFVLTTLFVT